MTKMITKDKNELKSGSKILVLGLILIIVLIGLFGSMKKVNAEDCTGKDKKGEWVPQGCTVPGSTETTQKVPCTGFDRNTNSYTPKGCTGTYGPEATPTTTTTKPPTCTGDSKVTADGRSCTYVLLAPIPCEKGTPGCVEGERKTFDPTNKEGENSNLSGYLNLMIKLFIGICAVLAVIMIVMGGIEYMTSELPGLKSDGKDRIIHAILGLLLALGAWTLLNTINPNLLRADLANLKNVEVTVELGGEGTRELNIATIKTDLIGVGIICPKDGGPNALTGIAQSYVGKSSYSQEDRNTIKNGKAMVDCSSYASQVYVCAGLPNPGGTSAGIFGSGSTAVTNVSTDGKTVNGVPLKVGDLIGWTAGGKEKYGHVMMYVGNGQMIDAQGQGGVAIRPVSSYVGRIKYIKPV